MDKKKSTKNLVVVLIAVVALGQNIWFMLMFQTVFRVYILMLFHGHWSVKM